MDSLTFPLGPAEPFAWPGGYRIGYLVDDGEFLCADCVNDPNNPVHIGDDIRDGWRIEGLQVMDDVDEGSVYCAHCNKMLS